MGKHLAQRSDPDKPKPEKLAAQAARSLPLPLALLDELGQVNFANAAMKSLVGFDPTGQPLLPPAVLQRLMAKGRAEVSLPGGVTLLQWTQTPEASMVWGAEVVNASGRRHTPPPGSLAHELEHVLARLLSDAPASLHVERQYDESLPQPRRQDLVRDAFEATLRPLMAAMQGNSDPALRLMLGRESGVAGLRVTHNAADFEVPELQPHLTAAGVRVVETRSALGGSFVVTLPL